MNQEQKIDELFDYYYPEATVEPRDASDQTSEDVANWMLKRVRGKFKQGIRQILIEAQREILDQYYDRIIKFDLGNAVTMVDVFRVLVEMQQELTESKEDNE